MSLISVPSIPDELVKKMTDLELSFAQLWTELYPNVDLEFQHPVRRYRIDFCHIASKTAIECQGATWVPNRGHSSGRGIQRDCQKFCILASLGFVVLPLTGEMITDTWLTVIAQAIACRLK